MEKCLLLFTANTNIFTPLYRQLKIGKSFIFAVWRNVMLNLSIDNGEKEASSMQKPYPIWDQNDQNRNPISDQNRWNHILK